VQLFQNIKLNYYAKIIANQLNDNNSDDVLDTLVKLANINFDIFNKLSHHAIHSILSKYETGSLLNSKLFWVNSFNLNDAHYVEQFLKYYLSKQSNDNNYDIENYHDIILDLLNNNNFIEGMFGVGLIESDLTRISGSNTLTGSRNGTQIFGSINYGKTLDKGDFNLTPIARVDLGYTELDAYSESGTDALSYGKQTVESGLASVGIEFSDIVKFNDNKLKPFGSVEYGMDFSNSSDVKMNYVSDTSTIYTYIQGTNSNHLITTIIGFEYMTINNLEIISSYKRIQGNESEQTDILNLSINFKSKKETEYAMTLGGSDDLSTGFDISKNLNGFDINFNANQSLNESSNRAAEVSLSRKF